MTLFIHGGRLHGRSFTQAGRRYLLQPPSQEVLSLPTTEEFPSCQQQWRLLNIYLNNALVCLSRRLVESRGRFDIYSIPDTKHLHKWDMLPYIGIFSSLL